MPSPRSRTSSLKNGPTVEKGVKPDIETPNFQLPTSNSQLSIRNCQSSRTSVADRPSWALGCGSWELRHSWLCRSGGPPAQHDVEAKGERPVGLRGVEVEAADDAVADRFRHAEVDRVERVQRIAGEIHLGDEARQEVRAEYREVYVRRPPRVVMVLEGVAPGHDRDELVMAFGVRDGVAGPGEVRVECRVVIVDAVRVPSGGV